MSNPPSITQCLNRMLPIHAKILRGEGEQSPLDSAWRGYARAARTLRQWSAMDGSVITDRGRELLAAWDARRTKR